MTSDEKFFAWLDGELSAAEAAEMEARVAANPELARLAEQHRAFGARLRGAFDPVTAEPLPGRLREALGTKAEVIDLSAMRRARLAPSLPQWASLAAMLAIGLFLGTMVPHRGGGPVDVRDGKLYASSTLNDALDAQLASAPAGEVRIGVTFRDHAGEICRSFTAQASSGLACRERGRWLINGLFARPEGQGGDYRMAAGMDPGLAGLVDSTMAGEPLDAASEKAARDQGWR